MALLAKPLPGGPEVDRLIQDSEVKASQLAARSGQFQMAHNPVYAGLAGYVWQRWTRMRDHKMQFVQPRLDACSHMRDGKYEYEKLQKIEAQGGSTIYFPIAAPKARTVKAHLADALMGTGADKPWSVRPTPRPELPQDLEAVLEQTLAAEIEHYYKIGNEMLHPADLLMLGEMMKATATKNMNAIAFKRVAEIERTMEDQLVEGNFQQALSRFVEDVSVFPFAVMKGPVPMRRKVMGIAQGGAVPVDVVRPEWMRVDPYKFFWAPWIEHVEDGPVIEFHNLPRQSVEAMIGQPGYSEDAVRAVLRQSAYGSQGWTELPQSSYAAMRNLNYDEAGNDMFEALQLWDRIPGKLLLEWGLQAGIDPDISYACEVWMINGVVVRAMVNSDALGRKPYYVTSFEKHAGRIDGNGVIDLCMDVQHVCNAAARALSNNMAMASGPMVGLNLSRIPAGTKTTGIRPWKVWAFNESQTGDNSDPVRFFQPNSNAAELLAVVNECINMADEFSGIPRQLSGQHVPGASRTSSGLGMLIDNASKSIKQVIFNIDTDVICPMTRRLYELNIKGADLDTIGDSKVVARGAQSLVVREIDEVRKRELVEMFANNPALLQIIGLPGLGELARSLLRGLGPDIERIIQPAEALSKQQLDMVAMAGQMGEAESEAERQAAAAKGGGSGGSSGGSAGTDTRSTPKQEDGTDKGGRTDNSASPRPNAK